MNTELLKTFLIVAETLNFRMAAKKLFLAQSTVSFRMRELETIFQQKFFEKEGKFLKITAAGEKMIPYAKEMISLETKMRRNIKKNENDSNTLRLVGVPHILEEYIFPVVSEYMKNHFVTYMEIKECYSQDVMERLRTERAHMVFSFQSCKMNSYENKLLIEDQIVLVTHVKNVLYSNGITIEELMKIPFCFADIFSLTDELAEWYHQVFSMEAQEFSFLLEMHSFSKIIEFLCTGEGYCFLPKHVVKKQLEEKDLRIIPLKFKEPPRLPVYRICKITEQKSKILLDFLKYFDEKSIEFFGEIEQKD